MGSIEPLIFHVEAKLRDHRVDFHCLDRLEQRGNIDAVDDIFSLRGGRGLLRLLLLDGMTLVISLCSKFDQSRTSDSLFACPNSLTIAQVSPAFLPARPAFLLVAALPYDELLRSPERFAGSPARGYMDVLSEVLKVVKLQGAMFYNGEFSSPWSFCSPPSHTVAPYVAPGAGHVIIYHLLTEGRASARLVDGERIILDAGDIVIFPHGDAHFIENGPPTKAVDMVKELARIFFPGVEAVAPGWRRGNYEIRVWLHGLRATTKPSLSQRPATGVQGQYSQRCIQGDGWRTRFAFL